MVVVSKSTLESMTQAPNLLTHFPKFLTFTMLRNLPRLRSVRAVLTH